MRCKPIFLTCLHTFLLLATVFALFSMFHVCYAEVIRVPQDHPTIQQAIDAASAGDTINVSRRSGESQSVYYERLVIDKQLTLVGESRETIIIDGAGTGTVIRIQADAVEIRGFTVRNGGQKYSGIRTNSYSYVTVANNTIKTNKNGVVFINSHYNTVVQNLMFNNSASGMSLSQSLGNTISDNSVSQGAVSQGAYGIKLSSTNATFVVNNTVADSSYGIYLEHSSNDTVDKNTLIGNSVDGVFPYVCQDIVVSNNVVSESAYGIQLYNCETVTVLGNNATYNSYGVYLAYSGPSNTIENNTISGNVWGVTLYGSSSNTFKGNTLSHNTYGVDPVTESNNNLFHHNNFLENGEQVVWNPDCLNTWDNGTQGNYWSDYTGTDSNGDGIGDTPYNIDPMNKDMHPLMIEWGGIHDVAIVNVTLSATIVGPGGIVYINVTAANEGTWPETFSVITYYNATATEWTEIETQNVANLASSTNRTLTFNWNTTEVGGGNYTIKAEASVVLSEIDTADNVYVDGTVEVALMVRDVAIMSVSPASTSAYQGFTLKIYVTVKNEGDIEETFDVSTYSNSKLIGIQTVTSLAAGANVTLTFNWDTTGVPLYVNYTIRAEASEVPNEVDLSDNTLVDDKVMVKIPGDVNGDKIVNIHDAADVSAHWYPGPPLGPLGYSSDADINGDGKVDIDDVGQINANWLRSQ